MQRVFINISCPFFVFQDQCKTKTFILGDSTISSFRACPSAYGRGAGVSGRGWWRGQERGADGPPGHGALRGAGGAAAGAAARRHLHRHHPAHALQVHGAAGAAARHLYCYRSTSFYLLLVKLRGVTLGSCCILKNSHQNRPNRFR